MFNGPQGALNTLLYPKWSLRNRNMNEGKVKCITCSSMILQSTSDRNHGLCGICKRDIEHLARNQEIGRFDHAWKALIKTTKMAISNNADSKQKILTIVDKFVDKNLVEQLSKPNKDVDYLFLGSPENYKEKLVGVYDQGSESNAYDLMGDKELDKEWKCPDVKFDCQLKEIPALPVLAAPFIIFNKSLIEKTKDLISCSVQYLPVNVIAKDAISNDFLALNILSSYEVWDLDISTWKGASWDETAPIYMRNMMVKDNLCINEHIFRNKDYPSLIIVSRELGKILKSETSKSISLQSMNKWHN